MKPFLQYLIMENQRKQFRHVMLHYFKKGNSVNPLISELVSYNIYWPMCSHTSQWVNNRVNEIFLVYRNGTTSVQTARSWFRKFGVGNFNMKDKENRAYQVFLYHDYD